MIREADTASAAAAEVHPPRVVAVVLNWNNLPDTLECVASLHRSDYGNLSVLVVDNDSDEDPTQSLRERFPGVRVLRNRQNLGYGGGNNSGIRLAMEEGAKYVLLLNNDAVVAPETVRSLVAAMERDDRMGMATPCVFYYERPTKVYWDGGTVDWDTGNTPHDSQGLPVLDGLKQSEWLDGCALLVRVATVHDVGLLEERYFLYFEDTEWSIRAARRGWVTGVVLSAPAWHKVSRSTGGHANPAVRFYYIRNRYLFLSAHRPLGPTLAWRLRYLSRIWAEYAWVRHERPHRVAVVAAFVSLLRHQWGPYQLTGTRWGVRILDGVAMAVIRVCGPIRRLAARLFGGQAKPGDRAPRDA